jgi:hypothetical protein
LRHDAFEIVIDDVDGIGFAIAITAYDFAGYGGGIGIGRLRENVDVFADDGGVAAFEKVAAFAAYERHRNFRLRVVVEESLRRFDEV